MRELEALTWAEPRAAGDPTQQAFDVELYDVVPIPFFPADLPDVDFTDGGFCWTQDELNEACRLARLSLFPNEGATKGLK